jgi:hypothetical protein
MANDNTATELKCKYCGGKLSPDTPLREIQADKRFDFYRCDACHMPNVVESRPDKRDAQP